MKSSFIPDDPLSVFLGQCCQCMASRPASLPLVFIDTKTSGLELKGGGGLVRERWRDLGKWGNGKEGGDGGKQDLGKRREQGGEKAGMICSSGALAR